MIFHLVVDKKMIKTRIGAATLKLLLSNAPLEIDNPERLSIQMVNLSLPNLSNPEM